MTRLEPGLAEVVLVIEARVGVITTITIREPLSPDVARTLARHLAELAELADRELAELAARKGA